jgi:hypothetical protein
MDATFAEFAADGEATMQAADRPLITPPWVETVLDLKRQVRGRKVVKIHPTDLDQIGRLYNYMQQEYPDGVTEQNLNRLAGCLGMRLGIAPWHINRMPIAEFVEALMPLPARLSETPAKDDQESGFSCDESDHIKSPEEPGEDLQRQPSSNSSQPDTTTIERNSFPASEKTKRSTERDEAKTKIISALTEHHQYETDSILNQEPIGVNALARKARVGKASVSRFFCTEFNDSKPGGHSVYRRACKIKDALLHSLKLLRGEVRPSILHKALRNPNELEGTDE